MVQRHQYKKQQAYKAIEGTRHIRNAREHALVYGKEKIRNLGTPNRLLAKDVPETNVGEISKELACRMREGQRVTPKEPL
jgi:hypothetical protein